MFGQKNTPPPTAGNNPNLPVNLNQKNDFNIEEMPIHTMAEDIDRIKNPTAFRGVPILEKKNTTIYSDQLTQKQKSSPFLNEKNAWNNHSVLSAPAKKPTIVDMDPSPKSQPEIAEKPSINPPPKRTMPPLDNLEENSLMKLSWKKVSIFATSLLLVAILAWTGYTLSKGEVTPAEITPPTIQEPEPIIEPIPETIVPPVVTPRLSYSQDGPNYLPIGLSYNDAEKIKTLLQQHIQKVAQEGYIKPIEFIITDEKNAPLTFKDFSTRLGLKLSPGLIDSLGETFSFFIFNDKAVSRIGLIIPSKDDVALAKTLLLEEKTLADGLNPFFFTTEYGKDKLFYNNEYKSVKIRYQNIISPENLTVDYAVTGNKLLLGTTKLTMYALIDHLAEFSNTTTKTQPTITPAQKPIETTMNNGLQP